MQSGWVRFTITRKPIFVGQDREVEPLFYFCKRISGVELGEDVITCVMLTVRKHSSRICMEHCNRKHCSRSFRGKDLITKPAVKWQGWLRGMMKHIYIFFMTHQIFSLSSGLSIGYSENILQISKLRVLRKSISKMINKIAPSSIWREKMPGYLYIICSSKLTVFLELRPRKTVCSSKQIMSAGISGFIIHQIFSLARDWSKRVTWVNIPQLKLGNIRGYSPIFKTALVA